MKRLLLLSLIALCIINGAVAQEGLGADFRGIKMTGGRSIINLATKSVERFEGGAVIELLPKEPNTPSIRIESESVHFGEPVDDEVLPEEITFSGNVVVNHPAVHLTANKAVWKRAEGIMVFTGNPVLKMNDKEMNMAGADITLNLVEGTLVTNKFDITSTFSDDEAPSE